MAREQIRWSIRNCLGCEPPELVTSRFLYDPATDRWQLDGRDPRYFAFPESALDYNGFFATPAEAIDWGLNFIRGRFALARELMEKKEVEELEAVRKLAANVR